jgi:hypothetical protein
MTAPMTNIAIRPAALVRMPAGSNNVAYTRYVTPPGTNRSASARMATWAIPTRNAVRIINLRGRSGDETHSFDHRFVCIFGN